MTHFMTGVIVPKAVFNKGEEERKSFIDGLMKPYSEEREITPYIEKPVEQVKEEFLKFKKNLAKEIKSKKVPDYHKKYVVNGKIKKISQYEWAKGYYGQELNDNGDLMTTWNTDSFWDWYRVGGRWDGVITENEQSSQDGFNFADKHETIKNNSVQIKELLSKLKKKNKEISVKQEAIKEIIGDVEDPLANFGFADIVRKFFKKEDLTKSQSKLYEDIMDRFKKYLEEFEFWNKFVLGKILTEEGLEQGKDYGWFGMSNDIVPKEDWIKKYTELLEKHQEDYIVTLDCHV